VGLVAHAVGASSSHQAVVPEPVTASPIDSSLCALQPATTSDVVTVASEHPHTQAVRNNFSWSEMATKGDAPAFISSVKQANKLPVCVGTNTGVSAKVKAVPRVLACFFGRLDPATTAEDLHEYLTFKGINDMYCHKLEPKNGKVYKTAAFKVTCCLQSCHLFQDESSWPDGAELRDWVYYAKVSG